MSTGVLAVAAAAPIVLVLVLMLAARWSAARAGAAALALALVIAATVFEFPTDGERVQAHAGVLAEGAFTTLTILWILWPALALHSLQESSGAIDTLRTAMRRLSPRPALQLILVAWFMALFFEGAAGFGTPVALAAPLLVSLGFAPAQAVVLALLGHACGVSFGALGTPVVTQAALTGLDAGSIARWTALLHAACGAIVMAFFVRAARPVAADERLWQWAAFAAAAFLVPSLAIATALGPELATLGAAMLGGGLFAGVLLVLQRRDGKAHAAPAGQDAATSPMPLRRALWPYFALVLLVVATRTIPAIADPLRELTLGWSYAQRYAGSVALLTHPGTLLFAALVIGAFLQGVSLRALRAALGQAARRLLPVSAALLAMLCLSRLMVHAGLIAALEQAAVAGLGRTWSWFAPAAGALGSFVTGSATASNVLFTSLQAQTAQALALPVVLIVAAQSFGAAVGNIVCPHNVVAGAATVGLAGREAEILRRTLLPCLAYLLAGGAVVTALSRLG